jgi:hypothetical protein
LRPALDGHELVHVVDLQERDADGTLARGLPRDGEGLDERERERERRAPRRQAKEWHRR